MARFRELSTSPAVWMLESNSMTPERLDSPYYGPRFLRDRDRLESLPFTVKDFRDVCARLNCGATPKLVEYSATGIPLIRTSNVRPNSFDASDVCRVKNMAISMTSAVAILPGDVLYTMSGTVGYAAVYPENGELASCSNTIARGRIRDTEHTNAHYIALFLNSSLGMSQSLRLISGGVLGHVMPNPVKRLRLLLPPTSIQLAIGNKIRKAERLRELSRARWRAAINRLERHLCISLVPATFDGFAPEDLNDDDYRCISLSPAIASATITDEIGAQYFHPRRIHASKLAAKTRRRSYLGDVARRLDRNGSPSGRFIGLDLINSETGVVNFHSGSAEASDTGCSSFSENDILFARLRPYLNKVSIWPVGKGAGVGSGELLVYRSNDIDPHYLFFVIKSPLGLNQVVDVTSGSTHPRVDANVVDQICVPRLDEAVEAEIGTFVREAHAHWYEAQDLLPLAKADVEALIDGTLDRKRLLDEGEEIAAWLAANPLGPRETEASHVD